MQKRRVVITGIGTVNALGNNLEDTWENMVKANSGIDTITAFDPSEYPSKIAGEVKNFDYKTSVKESSLGKLKRMDPFVHYALVALKEAVDMAGIDLGKEPFRTGVCVGTGVGGLHAHQNNVKLLVAKGQRRVNPFYIPAAIPNIVAGVLGIEYGFCGPNFVTSSACASANHAIGCALMIIQSGMADVMVSGGSEGSINEIAVAGFSNMKALSTKYNDTPQKASRPYDVDRDGFVIGEGAGIFILEEYEYAKKRGAKILSEVLSVGMTCDAYDFVMPDPEGMSSAQCMKMAFELAEINPEDVDYINAHATSTPIGDVAESKAINIALNGKQDDIYVGSTKSLHGHLLGATAAVEAIACIMAIRDNVIPANINIDNFDPAIELTCVNAEVIEKDVKIAVSNSFGFGGHNSTLILREI